MMTTKRFALTPLFIRSLFPAVALTSLVQAQDATIVFNGGNLDVAANWEGGAFPELGETGVVTVDSSFNGSGAAILSVFGDLTFGGGSVLTASIDFVAGNPSSVTFNDVTVDADDDIFTGSAGGNFIFNEGSITNVDDDFEANAGGTITINGGTHTVGLAPTNTANFGAQNNSTLNFLGGVVSAEVFRVTDTGTINLGGEASLTAESIDLTGAFEIASNWSGTLSITSVTNWQEVLSNGGATLDGEIITQEIFASRFEVTGDGSTLNLINPTGGGGFANSLQFQVTMTDSGLEFSWNSEAGMEYDLVSSDNPALEQDSSLWAPYNDGTAIFETIPSAGTARQILTGVQLVGPRRLFALIERPATEE